MKNKFNFSDMKNKFAFSSLKNKFTFSSVKNHLSSEKEVNGRRRLYNSLWALLFGVLASTLIIAITGNNPFEVFEVIFSDAIAQNVGFITTTIVFVVATLGTALCFKSGIFNIGVSGQMMAGGITSILILKLVGINGGTIVLSILLSMVSGALVAMVVGVLKAFLKVNEVVSTILLNWIVFYIIKFIIQSDIPGLVSSQSIAQNQTEIFNMPDFFQTSGWLALLSIFGVVMIFIMWFVFAKTTLGYKMKMLAMNKDASKYAGSNAKVMIIVIMSISGALSGLAGFLYYTELGVISAKSEPNTMGFDTIAIALLVYNNSFGIGIASILFAIIKLGGGSLKPLFPPLTEDFAQIMFGIIIYVAAIGVVFEKFKIYTLIKNQYIYWKDPHYKLLFQEYFIAKKKIRKIEQENNNTIKILRSENAIKWKEIKEKSIKRKESLDDELLANSASISKKEIWKQMSKKTISKKEAWKKLTTRHDILTSISEEQQQKFFSEISLIKKEKDDELFVNKYYEVAILKGSSKNLKIENKNKFYEQRNIIIQNYELQKEELKNQKDPSKKLKIENQNKFYEQRRMLIENYELQKEELKNKKDSSKKLKIENKNKFYEQKRILIKNYELQKDPLKKLKTENKNKFYEQKRILIKNYELQTEELNNNKDKDSLKKLKTENQNKFYEQKRILIKNYELQKEELKNNNNKDKDPSKKLKIENKNKFYEQRNIIIQNYELKKEEIKKRKYSLKNKEGKDNGNI